MKSTLRAGAKCFACTWTKSFTFGREFRRHLGQVMIFAESTPRLAFELASEAAFTGVSAFVRVVAPFTFPPGFPYSCGDTTKQKKTVASTTPNAINFILVAPDVVVEEDFLIVLIVFMYDQFCCPIFVSSRLACSVLWF